MIKDINRYIDHTLLKANAREIDIVEICEQAIKYNFYAVCVNPFYVELAKKSLSKSNTKVCTVIGFPLGQNTTETKVFETHNAINNGADEIDVVINIPKFLEGDYNYLVNELKCIREVCTDNIVLKVIIETCYLDKDKIIDATKICEEIGANFVKTSTGFGTRGASIEDIVTIKNALSINSNVGIKASGGIKDRNFAEELIEAGATRLGTSSGVILMN